MKSYNKCLACGIEIQYINDKEEGYSPKENSLICQRCFQNKNYGVKQNNLTKFDISNFSHELKGKKCIMIIDALNIKETLIKNINKYIEREDLTILVNKIDLLPKLINEKRIIKYISRITEKMGIEFKNLSLISSIKNRNIDIIFEFITEINNDISIIGYSNVGKSSFIKSLFKSRLHEIDNLVSNTIGTTLKPIELKWNNNKIIDFPGFFLEGNYQNILSISKLNNSLTKKEIKIRTYQLEKQQMIKIDDLLLMTIGEQKNKLGYQFSFSNSLNITRHKIERLNEYMKNDWKKIIIKPINNIRKQDIVISGLGFITFENINQEINIYLPFDVKVYTLESLYN